MTIPEICIPIIIALTGIAYPISIQAIARIEDKYVSNSIRGLFENEWPWKLFRYALWITLGVILVYSIRNVFEFSTVFIHRIIWILFLCTAITVFSFLFFAEIIFNYYSPSKLKADLLNRSKTEFLFFELRDLLFYGAKHDPNLVCEQLLNWFSDRYKTQQKLCKNTLEYDQSLYDLIYDLQVLITGQPKNQNYTLQRKVFGGEWLLGDEYYGNINKNIYRTIWEGFIVALLHKRNDLILTYWKISFQYIEPTLNIPGRKFDEEDNYINETEVKHKERERNRFLEFHYALGGLLLYSTEYSLIRAIFNYTTIHPPRYKLLPSTMNEVFTAFLWFWDQNDRNIPFISFKFPFPDFTGVAADGHIKYWISKYTALLFVRQFYLHQYFVTTNHLKHPQITDSNKQALHDYLPYFIHLVEDIMRNSALTDVLSYQEHNRKGDPITFLRDLQTRVEEEL